MSNLLRRDFLTRAAAFAAATTATLAGTRRAVADDKPPQPIRGKEDAPIIGPTNPTREAQSADRLAPPKTDHGLMPNLRWSFVDSHNKLEPGGWARQTTVREMPIATQLACVNMRLKPGAIRELHWHKAAEWGFVLKGRVRITAIDQDGHAFQDDVGEGDLRGAGSASPTPPSSRRRRRSRRGWSRWSPAGCASCTGTRTRTSCSITSRASRG